MTFCRSRRHQVVEIKCCRLGCWPHNPKVGGSNPPPATMNATAENAVAFARLEKRQFPRSRSQTSHKGVYQDLSGSNQISG